MIKTDITLPLSLLRCNIVYKSNGTVKDFYLSID